MFKVIKAIMLLVIISALLIGCCNKDKVLKVDLQNDVVNVSLKDKVLCASESVQIEGSNTVGVFVDIPPNASITKIYASITQEPAKPIDYGQITITVLEPEVSEIFKYRFNKDTSTIASGFETTLVQPLCVGPEGARVRLNSFKGLITGDAYILDLTVIYCPDYCTK